MNCKKCNAYLTENDQFCKNCGAVVSTENNEQNQIASQQAVNQNYSQPISQNYSQPISQNYGQPISQNYGQPISQNYGQSMQQTYGNAINYNQTSQKNNTSNYIIFGAIGGVAIIAIILIVGILMRNDSSSSLSGGNNSGISQSGSNQSTYKVRFENFLFNIPDDLIYEENNGVLTIGDEDDTWITQIVISEGNFANLKSNKSQLQQNAQQMGATSSIAQIKTLGGVEFIIMELSVDGQNLIAAYAKANTMYFMSIAVLSMDNEFDYSLLEKIAPIISSATYSESTTNMESGINLDMDKIAKLAK